ncbi:MAG: ABC transporter permease [Deltaproteobacteria bacterium]|nr:ABC transporter permease [Deltaproteobacteria bacterium]
MLKNSLLETEGETRPSIRVEAGQEGLLTVRIEGRLDSTTTGGMWREALGLLEKASSPRVVVDASGVDYCDGTGIGLLLELRRRQEGAGGEIEIRGLRPEFQRLLDLFASEPLKEIEGEKAKPLSVPEEVGRAAAGVWQDLHTLIAFVGEVCVALLHALLNPRAVRWKDAFLVAETAGVNALPIIALISFLMGLIMAFQSAIPMRQFGADMFVADLVAIAMVRELGPLMTAIVLAGRSGSAFAAELGTMKVNEEIDALTTMGLDPVRFLVVTRLIGALATTPLLTVFSNLLGVIGGLVVFLSLGYPLVTYVNRIVASVGVIDLAGGLFKAFVFGMLIAGIGCLRGLETKTGASAVGEAATRAVVSGILLIVLTDGIFGVLFFYLGI